ncbi:hypothetical protein K3495_g8303 [Podosphaera aphanis]|nr:hypothetical protein K3495_g8303 [Podosphaera aphanis]
MSLSPRTLYAQYFDNPASNGRGAIPGKRFKKDLNVLTGYDVSTSDKEFDALPIAVRRKYISTLERLWFAQNSRAALPISSQQKSSLRQESCPATSSQSSLSSHTLEFQLYQGNLTTVAPQNLSIAERRGKSINCIKTQKIPQKVQRSSKSPQAPLSVSPSSEPSLLDIVNPKISAVQPRGVTDKSKRSACLLGATDSTSFLRSVGGVYMLSPHKQNQRSFIHSPSPNNSPRPRTRCTDKVCDADDEASEVNTGSDECDKFRWMNESSNPDLRSSLDDYHANLDGVVIPSPSRPIRPSFRRQISINDIPFGRVNKLSEHQTRPEYPSNLNCRRSRSRKLASANTTHIPLASQKASNKKTGRHGMRESYESSNSPETEQKISPKIFRSIDVPNALSREKHTISQPHHTKNHVMKQIPFANDNLSLSENDASLGDSESPVTPTIEGSFQSATSRKTRSQTSAHFSPTSSTGNKSLPNYTQTSIIKPMLVKKTDTQNSPSGTKEITLKMTLTRPDLRSPDSDADLWQGTDILYRAQSLSEILDEKPEIKGPFGGPDGWEPEDKIDSVVKRLWNRVTQPRNTS